MIRLFTAESAILLHALIWCIGFYDEFYFWIIAGFSLILHGIHYTGQWYSTKKKHQDARKQIWNQKMLELEDEWFNKLLSLFWPHIGNVVKNIVHNVVQQSIRSSSSMFSTMTFTDVDIGNRSPHISHIHIYGEAATFQKEIVADFDFDFQSNCNIDFKLNRLKAGITDFSIKGLFRVQLSPLLEDVPLIGAVTMCFVEEPEINYDLTSLANILDFPGMDKLLQYAVAQVVKSQIVLPQKVCFLVDQNIQMSEVRYPMPKGVLLVTVVEAKNLQVQNRSFMSRKFLGMKAPNRPYVVVTVGGFEETTKVLSGKTPTWNAIFPFIIFDTLSEKINFIIYDDDRIYGSDTCIARVSIPVECVNERGFVDKVVSVSKSNNGKLHVRMQWHDLSQNSKDLREAGIKARHSQYGSSALLSIYVEGAKYLPNGADPDNVNPALKITVQNEEFKTNVATKTNNPTWQENFRAYLTQPENQTISFEILNSTKREVLGILNFHVRRLIVAPEMTLDQDFPLRDSGNNSMLNLKMTLQGTSSLIYTNGLVPGRASGYKLCYIFSMMAEMLSWGNIVEPLLDRDNGRETNEGIIEIEAYVLIEKLIHKVAAGVVCLIFVVGFLTLSIFKVIAFKRVVLKF